MMKNTMRGATLLSVLLLSGCSDWWCWPFDCSSGSSAGVNEPTTKTGNMAGVENPAPPTPGSGKPVSSLGAGTKLVRFEFRQTVMHCPEECVFLFDSIKLIIETDKGTVEREGPRFVVREDAGIVGSAEWDISEIPAGATIQKATLWMEFDQAEGIAGADETSVMEVYGFYQGQPVLIRTLHAGNDIKAKGYSKSNPLMPVDFTSYMRNIHWW